MWKSSFPFSFLSLQTCSLSSLTLLYSHKKFYCSLAALLINSSFILPHFTGYIDFQSFILDWYARIWLNMMFNIRNWRRDFLEYQNEPLQCLLDSHIFWGTQNAALYLMLQWTERPFQLKNDLYLTSLRFITIMYFTCDNGKEPERYCYWTTSDSVLTLLTLGSHAMWYLCQLLMECNIYNLDA